MNYKKLNVLGGWFVFLIALVVYTLTVEPTASYWDCGEFIAVSYKLQTPHPPGVPIYILIARLFSLIASDKDQIAFWVNMVSVVSSAFTILFMFWTTSYIGRKLLKIDFKDEPSESQTFLILAASLVGSLAFTFSDSFWFNAVEAEVYAMSMFFSAFVYWSMLKWESVADDQGADKWLLLTAYMVGLSLGVHILNLVMIPGLALIYYFRKYDATLKGAAITLVISIVGLGVILEVMYYGFATMAKHLDFFLVNSLGMNVNAGIFVFLVLMVAAFVGTIVYSIKTQKYYLNLGTLSFMFIVIGYLSYAEIVIRSNVNPPIDENNPENAYNLEKYLRRDQYGSTPLVSGVQFGVPFQNLRNPYGLQGLSKEKYAAKLESWRKPLYMVQDNKWVVYEHSLRPEYASKHKSFLPRMTHANDRNIQVYESVLEDIGNYRPGQYKKKGWKPSFTENVMYMLRRQLGTMYFRYFGWNFIGRDGDLQFSGVRYPWSDDVKPASLDSKAVNNFYMLPFILGLLGVYFLFNKSEKDFYVSGLLFLFTGVAIVVYLNAPAVEPRERDYAYAGSYYIFAIWIGLGVMALADLLKKSIKNPMAATAVALVVSLSVPTLMASQGWDDHDRSKRYYSVESAVNMLETCAPNAILFTEGDNDTFPLWFAQEVLEVRQDVRVCNTSLLGTSWYINQMAKKAYASAPLPIGFKASLYQEGVNDGVYYQDQNGEKEDNLISLHKYMAAVKGEKSSVVKPSSSGGTMTVYPSKRFSIPYKNKQAILDNGAIPEKYKRYFMYSGLGDMKFTVNSNTMTKDQVMTLEMLSEIAKGNWERPMYFASIRHAHKLGLHQYLINEGMAYRLIPFDQGNYWNEEVDVERMYYNLVENEEIKWTNLDDPSIHYSDQHANFVSQSRNKFSVLARALFSDTSIVNRKEKALAAIDKCLTKMPSGPFFYERSHVQMAMILNGFEEKEKAVAIVDGIAQQCKEEMQYRAKNKGKSQYGHNYYVSTVMIDDCVSFYNSIGDLDKAKTLAAIK